MSRAIKLQCSTLAVVLTASLTFARPDNPSSETRSIIVSVVDRNGSTVRDLKKENFQVRVHGKVTPVIDAHYELAPRRVLVLFDLSGSMGAADSNKKWQIAHEALDALLKETPREVPLAMVTFSGNVRDILDFSQGRSAIANWMQQASPNPAPWKAAHGTALFDALDAALRLMQPVQPGDAIYAITDGGENRSRENVSEVDASLLASGVRLFAFFFSDSNRSAPEELSVKDRFLQLVQKSGGFTFGVTALGGHWAGPPDDGYRNDLAVQKSILAQAQELNLLVHGLWTLNLSVPPSNRNRSVQIEILDGAGKPRKDIDFIYPRELVAKTP